MIRAGLSGTNWTGKSTTIARFRELHPELTLSTVSLSEVARCCPYPMVEEQTRDASRWMVERVRSIIADPPAADVQLFDRTPVDIVAFSLLALERAGSDGDEAVLEEARALISELEARGMRIQFVGVNQRALKKLARELEGLVGERDSCSFPDRPAAPALDSDSLAPVALTVSAT